MLDRVRTVPLALLSAVAVAATLTAVAPAASAAPSGRRPQLTGIVRPQLVPLRRHDVPIKRTTKNRVTAADGTQASLVAAPPAGPARSTWEVTYSGFDAASNAAGPQAQVAFQAAVDIWSRVVTSTVPIRVDASFAHLPPYVLGSAGSSAEYPNVGDGVSFYSSALADAISGTDQAQLYAGAPSSDITAQFSSDPTAGFYFGTDGAPPADKTDFETVVLHELGHGLGFAGSMTVDGSGNGSYGDQLPERFDRFAYDAAADGSLLVSRASPSASLADALQSGSVFWGGAAAVAAAGGSRPRLYAPSTWEPGSSFSHLDEGTYGVSDANSLMTPMLSAQESVHSPGPLALAMLTDEGWQASVPAPATATVTLTGPGSAAVAQQSATFTAQVSSAAGVPSGPVTFLDGATPIGTVQLSAGSASLATAALSPGSHQLTAQYAGDGQFPPGSSAALNQQVNFTDVPNGAPFYNDIYWLTDRKITTGNADGSFAPGKAVVRQAFAAYLYRFAHGGADAGLCATGTSVFPDVADSNPFCGDIRWLASTGITGGFSDGGFHPTQALARQATAAFLYRYNHAGADAGQCAPGTSPFNDVPETNPLCGDIAWLAATTPQPITTGFADGGFHPSATTPRQAIAAYFHRYATDFPPL
jgi:hypothetical protein